MSARPLDGVCVIEVASHVFVPAGTALLAEWGAEVLKVEHPETGDAYRGLVTAGLHRSFHGVDVNFQYANRSKESLGIDLSTSAGRDLVLRLAAEADVFVTSFRPSTLARLGLDIGDLRAVNPSVIYGRGTGYGPEGPDADTGAYDHAAYWARSGIADRLVDPASGAPLPPPPGFGDYGASLVVAAGISAALFRRATTGEGSVVDVSLLATGMWQLQPDVIDSHLGGTAERQPYDRLAVANPLVNQYRTRDGRWLMLVMVASDKHWANLCEIIGRPDLAGDPRFANAAARRENNRACIDELNAVFAARDFADWCEVLRSATGEWAPVARPGEVLDDPQVRANGYVGAAALGDGAELPMVGPPVQFDRASSEPRRAPEVGEHTELALVRLGLSWDEIAALKASGAII